MPVIPISQFEVARYIPNKKYSAEQKRINIEDRRSRGQALKGDPGDRHSILLNV
jgi:hypothetical protein